MGGHKLSLSNACVIELEEELFTIQFMRRSNK
jgi:hypothetical protein